MYDSNWDLVGFAGFSRKLDGMVISFRGTDSHSIYNWAENMRYWRTDLQLPLPDADGALVHTGELAPPPTFGSAPATFADG